VTRISELAIVTTAVADLERAERFYTGVFDYVAMARGAVPVAVGPSWRVPAGCAGRYVTLGRSGTRRGLLRLVEFDRPGQQIWGRYERIQDHGHYALNMRVPDVHATWERLRAGGARPKSGPTRWNVDETMVAIDSQAWDPDGTLLDVYTMEGRPGIFTPLGTTASPVETIAIHVENADRSRDFYFGLGYTLFFDRRIADLNTFFHLPAGVALRDVNLVMPGSGYIGRIEIVQLEGTEGVRVQPRAAPPNHGILSITFDTDDCDAAVALALSLGATRCGDPVDVDWGAAGLQRSGTVYGPDGELIEFRTA
jgi:catechol 2,3-dioxygenase-like lactoylglutathione lyase family enzyme